MKTRTIGSLEVTILGLGCNNFARNIDEPTSQSVVHAALDAGVTFFDTSDRYGNGDHPFSGRGQSEVFLGRALRGRRDEVVLATKFGNQMGDDPADRGGGRRWVRQACEDSLRRLGTDRIDLYQIHRPDQDTPIEETLGVLGELVEEGKIREVGCSNFEEHQLVDAEEAAADGAGGRFVSVQNEYSLLCRDAERDVLPACVKFDIAFIPYFPLAGGLLTGKYRRGLPLPEGARITIFGPNRPHLEPDERNLETVERLVAYAADHGRSLLDLAFAWLIAHDRVASVIAGATRVAQVEANARAVEWVLTSAQRDEVNGLLS